MRDAVKSKARSVSIDALAFTPRFEYGVQASVAVVTGSEDGTVLGTGYVRMSNAEIPWTIQYDEVVLVLEGEITIRTEEGDLHASAHESIWLPKGTKLTYISKNALLFYTIHPNNWAESAP